MKLVRMALALVLLVSLGTAVTGCGIGNSDTAATVNGEKIKLSDLNKQLEQLKKQYPQMFSGTEGQAKLLDFKKRLLDNLINQSLVTQAAKQRNIQVSDADVQAQINNLKQGFKTDAEFQKALANAGMDQKALEGQIRDQLLSQKLVESISKGGTVTAAQVKAYYDKNKKQFFQPAAKRASHILFDLKDKKTADKVLAEVKASGDFAQLAKKYSKDPGSAANGGDLGWPTTPYVPEFQAALDKLAKNQISALVKTQFGYHIIKVTDERPSKQLSLKDATKQIEQILQAQTRADDYQKFLDQLRKTAKIEIVAADLKADGAQPATKGK